MAISLKNTKELKFSGSWYPSDDHELHKMISHFLRESYTYKLNPKMIISPHAGLVYSGSIAATVISGYSAVSIRFVFNTL